MLLKQGPLIKEFTVPSDHIDVMGLQFYGC